jgi:putative DNA primase/helicase
MTDQLTREELEEMRRQLGEIRPSEFSDDTLALQFSSEHANLLRYVSKWGRWMIWDGKRWQFDEKLRVFDLVRECCREQAHRCNDPCVKAQLTSAKTVGAVHRLAQMDQRTAAVIDQWDADPWLLNTPDGVIDLRTGERRDAKAEDYMTKITALLLVVIVLSSMCSWPKSLQAMWSCSNSFNGCLVIASLA